MRTFNEVAQAIIDETIKSAILIDDSIPKPFSGETEVVDICQSMYESFHDKQCSLDFYKYTNESDNEIENKVKLLFERKDLLVLDWELNSTEPKYKSTLDIINRAVYTDNLHFICIYSKVGDKTDDIFYKIMSYFSGNNLDQIENLNTEVGNLLEADGSDYTEIIDSIKSSFKELTLGVLSAKEISVTLGNSMNKKTYGQFRKILNDKLPQNKSYCSLSRFGFIINDELLYKSDPKDVYLRCNHMGNYLQINNTLISVFPKTTPAKDLYEQFCNAIINANDNFLTIMSLELRNQLLERSAFIGKDLSKVDEKAFFHHMETINPDYSFYEFLISLWSAQNTTFLHEQIPQIFSTLSEYKVNKGIDLNNQGNLQLFENDLTKLNYFYNTDYKSSKNDKVGFGDIFSVYDKDIFKYYLICITPHCDCLHPDNINGFYHFVRGAKTSYQIALNKPESSFTSFIKEKDNYVPIEWTDKPFTLYLCEDQRICGEDPKKVIIGEDTLDIKFLCKIKDNYAQRIANNAFAHPIRVGITFAEIKNA